MNFRTVHAATAHSLFTDIALLLVRLMARPGFHPPRLGKIRNPCESMGPDGASPDRFAINGKLSSCRHHP